jgi:hypothetical protein
MTEPTKYHFETAELDARTVRMKWRSADLAEGSIFKIVRSEIPTMKSVDSYEGKGLEALIDGLKPLTKYKFILKVCV